MPVGIAPGEAITHDNMVLSDTKPVTSITVSIENTWFSGVWLGSRSPAAEPIMAKKTTNTAHTTVLHFTIVPHYHTWKTRHMRIHYDLNYK